ncbi:L,D-transpeptidase [Variovorax arabinosiphilus]|uniref:L,D-transpeptidase n=1 Tax=Variovorax arabinosiphilus TaxID=3053498 RepID=UPI002578643D|nr:MULTISPECIES: L,D-transpeptidase [unclassified Variovorax]MDM0122025.1 L,D-transpeptidase [Variovorax sp. J2L1-78]MDM0131445.1 L,D-transpeptidase [Variovorax sp. J2L1-63]MDM0234788.1 L,D-transpeptidase [Variovorax sp. J2R1-6]
MHPSLLRLVATWLLCGATLVPAYAATGDAQASAFVQRAVATGDNRHQPFALIDKKKARLLIYDANGSLMASSPVLLGLARGDVSVPGIGERPIAQILPHERTTPAGRFVSEPGRNTAGEDIVWVDYDAAISMHRVRATNKAERRLQRLASPSAHDNRISYGCINVPAAFYDTQVKPVLGTRRGLVYVLPESSPMPSHFAFLTDDEPR